VDRSGINDRTPAILAVRAHERALTPEQRSAVDAYLEPPPGSVTVRIPPTSVASIDRVTEAAVQDDLTKAIEKVATDFRAQIAGKLGRDVLGDVTITYAGGADGEYGSADPDYAGGVYAGCKINLTAKTTGNEPLVITNTLAHELFHCFQYDGYRTAEAAFSAPGWVIEGEAAWVGTDIGGVDASNSRHWMRYLTNPPKSLFLRAYDAIGFFAHLAETGTDPWSVFRATWAAGGDSPLAFRQADADRDSFLDSWSSGLLRQPARGSSWDTTSPDITDDAATPIAVSVGNGDTIPFAAAPYTNDLEAVTVSADVFILTGTGNVRFSDGQMDQAQVERLAFCGNEDRCRPTCPDGSALPEQLASLGPEPVVAATGGQDGSSGLLVGMTIEDFCQPAVGPVWVKVERPSSPGVLAGTVVELYGCDGPYGSWNGLFRLGGLDAGDGFTVPFAEVPVSFSFPGSGGVQETSARVKAQVPSPIGNVSVAYDLNISTDGTTLSINGKASGATGVVSLSHQLGALLSNLPIEPAPAGKCP
jgi:hypothetical protein